MLIASGFTWFGSLAHLPDGMLHVAHGLIIFTLILVLSVLYRKALRTVEEEVVPDESASLKNVLQAAVEGLLDLVDKIVHHGEEHLRILGAAFIYIFLSNLMGLIPGFLPPTENINTNLAVAAVIFVYFNYVGIKKQGFGHYMAHFAGPMLALSPLIFPIEIFGTLIRPVSLSLRLFGNINGDHLVVTNIAAMAPLGAPIVFMAFGIFVCFIQAFVFTLLSSVYVALASSSDH